MASLRMTRSTPALRASLSIAPLLLIATLAWPAAARVDDTGWPREFTSGSGAFVVYQPQPEDLRDDLLSGRAAFSLQKPGDTYPTFGVLWFTERIEVDRDSSTVTARSFDVTRVRLPSITPVAASEYERLVEAQAAHWDLSGTLEELQAGLAAAEKERASVAGLDNAPPRIIFYDRRAILVVYDGFPELESIEGTNLERVVNTPFAVVFDPEDRDYYLNGANLWYRARTPLGPWSAIARPPGAVRQVVPPDTSAYDQVKGTPPEVLTATEPTELISTDGPPRYAPLVDDELLYVTNTESDVIREVSTQALYVLVSGRWFRAPAVDGPWTYVRGDQLPESFQRVPPDSPKGHILASVAGTDQAEDAVADAEIPQTSAIRRGDRSFMVAYDGAPQFEPIEGTDLQYAVNTDAEVILADGRYYACDQGVWYIADDPNGPWYVSETRPLGVEDIPASCPVYDVRFVYVYDWTPEVVYVGYTPGYLGCYPYYGTVVYGTGYRYRTWRGRHHYYPRRFTWGFQARYNPWLSRWSFGYSYGTGFLRIGTRWRAGQALALHRSRSMWFGPGGFRRPLLGEDMTLLRSFRTQRVRTRVADALPWNVYNRPENVQRVDRALARIPSRSIARPILRPGTSPNDVFAGQDGKVYRRDQKGSWEVREGTKWKPAELPSSPPSTQVPSGRGPSIAAPPPSSGGTVSRPQTGPTPTQPRAEPRRPNIQAPAPSRETQRERPARPSERPSQPPERPTPPQERPTPPQERPTPQPRERPTPPPVRPTPGDLEREFRARERSERPEAPRPQPPPQARPTPPSQEQNQDRPKEPPRERPQEPSREKRGR